MRTVYEKKPYIEYTYKQWQHVDFHRTSGSDKKPYWHDMSGLAIDGATLRQGAKNENYKVKVIPEK
jgi:hypothetical protein